MARYVVKNGKIEQYQETPTNVSSNLKNDKWYNNFFQKGDSNPIKATLSTANDAIGDFLTGALTPVENVVDFGANIVASAQNALGYKDAAEKTRDFANHNSIENMFKDEDVEKASVLGSTTDKITNLIGYTTGLMYGGKLLSSTTGVKNLGITGKNGKTLLGGSFSGGNIGLTISGRTLNLPTLSLVGGATGGLQEANSKENVSEKERWTKALSSSLIEGTSEGLFGILGVGGSDFSETLIKNITSKFSSRAGKMLVQTGISATGEMAEEFLSYVGNYLSDNHLIDKLGDADFSSKFDWGELGEQMALAFVSSTLSQGGGSIVNSNNAIKSAEQQLGRKLTTQEKAQVTQSSIEGTLIEKINKLKKEQKTQNAVTKMPTVNDIVAQNQNTNMNQIMLSDNFSKQVDEVLNGTFNKENHMTVLEHTPKVLQKLGVKDLPITLTTNKLERIMNESGNQSKTYHNLGELVKKLPEAIQNPLDIIKSHNNSYVLTTDLSDNQDRSVIVSLKIDGKGYINNIEVDTNVMTSAYGRNNYDTWMERQLKAGNIVYDIDRGYINEKKLGSIPGLQLSNNRNKLNTDVQGLQLPNEVSSRNESTGGKVQFPTISNTKDKVQFPIQGNSISYDNNTTISQNSQIAPLSNNINMQNNGNNSTINYSKSDIDSFNTYTDSNGNEVKIPDDLALNLVENTTINIEDMAKLQSIIENSNINENNNTITYNGQFDNNNYSITAHRQNDVYLIDNMVKKSINPLPSVKQQTIDNYQDVVDDYGNYKESKFYKNATEKSKFITKENRDKFKEINDLKYYKGISNEATLNEAYQKLNKGGMAEISRWLTQENKISTAVDIAEGWILLESYQEAGDYDSMVQTIKKMRRMGTIGGQTIQAFNIMSRLTPEGMVKYAVSELSEAYEIYSKNKSKTWIDENASKFDLTPEETGFIVDTMKEVEQMADGREKNVKLAEIQKMLNDKLPPDRGDGIKAWMRISMLFNPKTQVRNVMGNAVIAPVNAVSDYISSKVDSIIAKKTGVRTTGKTDVKSYAKGFKKGLFESYDDFKRGINTRNIQGNRFEVGQAKSFNNDTKIGKTLNRVDSLLSFMLDVGDRGFYEASFTNSINNQLVLNNKTEVTQEMIDIATQEALQRTWQDNNDYTRFVLSIRSQLNKINIKGYGLGDVLIPFAKTPANLTKAIVDYSPLGMVKTINEGINLKRSLTNGQFTAQMQHQFVQDLGKATAGTILYVLGYALAKAGMTTGESDDDKDVSNFMKNTLGVSSYSIKIGNKTFTYDWMQPVAAPFAITANIVNKQKQEANLLENVISSLDTAGNILLQQSFLDSLNTVFNNNDGIVSGLQEAILELPSRAIPTLFKQIVDLTDSTQRTSFEYDKPLETMFNKVKAKIPGLSKTLAASVDTLGREIQRYGGKNNLFNVFLNPANVNTENVNESAKEIYNLYKETGETTIMPRVAPYYINKNGNKIILNSQQRAEYQKISGEIIEKNIQKLIGDSNYDNLNNDEKVEVISDIVNFSYNVAQSKILGTEISDTYKKAYFYSLVGNVSDYYLYKSHEFESDYYENGNVITNSKKNKIIKYINGLNLTIPQKAILIKMEYSSYDNYNSQIVSYINKMNYSKFEKASILKQIGFDNYDKYLINYVNSQKIGIDEKIEILEDLGFTIRNGRVYS